MDGALKITDVALVWRDFHSKSESQGTRTSRGNWGVWHWIHLLLHAHIQAASFSSTAGELSVVNALTPELFTYGYKGGEIASFLKNLFSYTDVTTNNSVWAEPERASHISSVTETCKSDGEREMPFINPWSLSSYGQLSGSLTVC